MKFEFSSDFPAIKDGESFTISIDGECGGMVVKGDNGYFAICVDPEFAVPDSNTDE